MEVMVDRYGPKYHAKRNRYDVLNCGAVARNFIYATFGPKRDKVTGEWRKLHNEELHNMYSSPNIVRVIKSIRMIWTGM
jgi:hypothetical protein